jgi:hypothetical protein
MDGALTVPVLTELFLRGVQSSGWNQPPPSRGRHLSSSPPPFAGSEGEERRSECLTLDAVALIDVLMQYLSLPSPRSSPPFLSLANGNRGSKGKNRKTMVNH